MQFILVFIVTIIIYLLFRVIKHWVTAKPPWPEEQVKEIEREYIKEYRRWTDITDGPSLIGIPSDLYRLQMLVMGSFAMKDPAVDFYYKEIIARFDDIDLSIGEKEVEPMNFEFIPSDQNPYGFTIKLPFADYEVRTEELYDDTEYLCVTFGPKRSGTPLNYLFDKNRNHISWKQRAEEVKDCLQKKEYSDRVIIEGRRTVRFDNHESGLEGWEYKLYKDGKLQMTSDTVLGTTFDDKYDDYLRDQRWSEEQETERKAIVDELLSLKKKKEQKHFMGRIIISDVDMSIFYGPVRDCGPVKEFPFTIFSNQFRELDQELLEELFIHAQTIFALYMNEGECYPENVDVKKFVKDHAEKFGVSKAFKKYFDETVELGDLYQYGLC